jgi:formylglycine-generating enzyme required for sulfatase activity
MGKYEVTQGEYLAVMGSNPSLFNGVPYPAGPDYGVDLNRPVESVLWEEAVDYCDQLTQREQATGRIASHARYRLPTETEWEYACRAWTSTRFSYGDDPGRTNLTDYSWHLGNSGGIAHPVGQKLPNPWGLYDMHGNVWEWCQDWYTGRHAGGIAVDPKGPATGSYRVIRGGGWGGWNESHKDCRSAFRYRDPIDRDSNVGFRTVLAASQP